MENNLLINKKRKLKEVIIYLSAGFLIGIDIILGYLLYTYKTEFFNFSVDFSRSIELGIIVIKLILLVTVLIINLKSLKSVIRQWKKDTVEQKRETRDATKGYKRLGWIRRALFYWRTNGARKWMDKYHEDFQKMQKTIGRIKGNETKELKKLKNELIKGILLWTDDFRITEIEYDKKGNERVTDIPVTLKFLQGLYLDELYEVYLMKCVDTSSRFIHGRSELEKEEMI